jgi:hypothetical protein
MNRNEVNHNEMKAHSSLLLHVLTLLALLVAAAMARLRVTMLDFNSLLTSYLQDDAFYYYKVASNIFSLHRITYDGEQLSNGFHPLWLALISFFYTPTNDGVDFVYRVQWIMFFCALLTVVALYFTLTRLRAGWFCSVIVTAVFCVHSTFVDMQMNGLETSLNTLMLLLLFNAFLTIFLNPQVPINRYIYFGVVTAAAFLVRTDNGIALLLLFLALAWISRRMAMQCWSRLLVGGLVALFLVLPWLIWNQVNFGSLVQGSGKVETIYWGEPNFNLQHILYNFLIMPSKIYQNMQIFSSIFISTSISRVLLGILFIGCWISTMFFLLLQRRSALSACATAVFCIAVFSVFCYHAAFRSFVRMWYFMPVGLVALLSIAGAVIWCRNCCKTQWAENAANVLLAVWLGSVVWLYSPEKLPGATNNLSSHLVVANWVNTNTQPDAVIGSMNSGVLGYLVHRKVINLDGVMDSRSMRAHWDKRRAEYIHERGIDYLVDNDGALALFCNETPLHTCQRVFSFGDSANPGRVVQVVKNSQE